MRPTGQNLFSVNLMPLNRMKILYIILYRKNKLPFKHLYEKAIFINSLEPKPMLSYAGSIGKVYGTGIHLPG